ncbi:hypothetical protein IQ07DRAFT_595288 [Pyrenochaeta sp. DS3sAY3a]|nr:hypothetical protein IQ07DRAFT_595288 [Pyrenochaeta sp. DS3sAY3a]
MPMFSLETAPRTHQTARAHQALKATRKTFTHTSYHTVTVYATPTSTAAAEAAAEAAVTVTPASTAAAGTAVTAISNTCASTMAMHTIANNSIFQGPFTCPATCAAPATTLAGTTSTSTVMSTTTAAAGATITAASNTAASVMATPTLAKGSGLFGAIVNVGTGADHKATTTFTLGMPTKVPAGATLVSKTLSIPNHTSQYVKVQVLRNNVGNIGHNTQQNLSPGLVRKLAAAYNKTFNHGPTKPTFLQDKPILMAMLVGALATTAAAGMVYWDREFYKSVRQQSIAANPPPGVDAEAFHQRAGILGRFLTQVTKTNRVIKRELGAATSYMIELSKSIPEKGKQELALEAAKQKTQELVDAHSRAVAEHARHKRESKGRPQDDELEAAMQIRVEALEYSADVHYAHWKRLNAAFHAQPTIVQAGLKKFLSLLGSKPVSAGGENTLWPFAEPGEEPPKPMEKTTAATTSVKLMEKITAAATSVKPVETVAVSTPEVRPVVELTNSTTKITPANFSTPVNGRKRGREGEEEVTTPKSCLSNSGKRRKIKGVTPGSKGSVTFDVPEPVDKKDIPIDYSLLPKFEHDEPAEPSTVNFQRAVAAGLRVQGPGIQTPPLALRLRSASRAASTPAPTPSRIPTTRGATTTDRTRAPSKVVKRSASPSKKK